MYNVQWKQPDSSARLSLNIEHFPICGDVCHWLCQCRAFRTAFVSCPAARFTAPLASAVLRSSSGTRAVRSEAGPARRQAISAAATGRRPDRTILLANAGRGVQLHLLAGQRRRGPVGGHAFPVAKPPEPQSLVAEHGPLQPR